MPQKTGRKAQITSFDLVISIIGILLFIAIIVAFAIHLVPKEATPQYGSIIVRNLPFLEASRNDYAVSQALLSGFESLSKDAAESEVMNNTQYNIYQYDMCLFFNDASSFTLIKDTTAGSSPCSASNVCGSSSYTSVDRYVRPVLVNNRIENLNVVICKK